MRDRHFYIFNFDCSALCLCGVSLLAWMWALYYKYMHFGYYDWDLAFFAQAHWQLLHGTQYVSLAGINYFGDHSYFMTLFTLPFFALVPHPLTLVLLKVAAYLTAAYLLYRISHPTLGENGALFLMFLYILFPANIFSIIYDFNPESFAPPILFWMFTAFQGQRWKSFFMASLLLILIKENMALIVCAFGLYGFLSKGYPKKTTVWILLFGLFIFYLLVIHAIPYFRHMAHHAFVVRYGYLGQSVGEILMNVLTQPHKIAGALFNDGNSRYIHELFGPLLVPALFSGHLLFFVSPVLLQHLLSTHPPEHSIYYHYGTTIAPFIFLAVMRTLGLCRQKFSRRIFYAVLFLLMAASMANLSRYGQQFAYRLNHHQDHLEKARWELVNVIAPDMGVIASFDYLAALSLRPNLYAFHKVYDDVYQDPKRMAHSELNTLKPFSVPPHVRYALIDFNDAWLQASLQNNPAAVKQRIHAFFSQGHWKPLKRCGSTVLFERSAL